MILPPICRFRCANLFDRKHIEDLPDFAKTYENSKGICNQLLTLLTMLIQTRIDEQKIAQYAQIKEPAFIVLCLDSWGLDVSAESDIVPSDFIVDIARTNSHLSAAEINVQIVDRMSLRNVIGEQEYIDQQIWNSGLYNHRKFKFQWYNAFIPTEVCKVFSCIKLNHVFVDLGKKIAQEIIMKQAKNKDIHIIHLRLEDANVKYLQKNYYAEMSETVVAEKIADKYCSLISEHIPKNATIYILGDLDYITDKTNFFDILFPPTQNYQVLQCENKSKYEKEIFQKSGQNVRALLDLCVAMALPEVKTFICAHDLEQCTGSTFSWWLLLHFFSREPTLPKIISYEMENLDKNSAIITKFWYKSPFNFWCAS